MTAHRLRAQEADPGWPGQICEYSLRHDLPHLPPVLELYAAIKRRALAGRRHTLSRHLRFRPAAPAIALVYFALGLPLHFRAAVVACPLSRQEPDRPGAAVHILRQPPIPRGHPDHVRALPPLQVGVEAGCLPRAFCRLEHEYE